MACEKSLSLMGDAGFDLKLGAGKDRQFFKLNYELVVVQQAICSKPVKAALQYLQKADIVEFHFVLVKNAKELRIVSSIGKNLVHYLCDMLVAPFLQIVIKDSDSRELKYDDEVYKNLTAKNCSGVGTFAVSLGWREQAKVKLCTDCFMQKLFEDEATKDVTLVAGDAVEVKCHKTILTCHSPAFAVMLSKYTGMVEAETGRIQMSENSGVVVRWLHWLLQYFYGVEQSTKTVPRDMAVELIKTAHLYHLIELVECLQNLFLGKDVEWFGPDSLLEMYFFCKNVDTFENLRKYLLFLMAGMNSQDLRSSEAFMNLDPADSVHVSSTLAEYLQNPDMPKPKLENRGNVEEGGEKSSNAKTRHKN